MFDEFLIILVRGLGVGSLYALIALSFNVIYRASHIINFAQGNMLVLCGLFAAYLYGSDTSLATWLVLVPLAAASMAALLAIQGAVTLLPVKHSATHDSGLITTMAASVIISALMLITQGPAEHAAQSPFRGIAIAGVRAPAPYVWCMISALAWFASLRLFYSKTIVGLAMSALSQDFDAARAAGISVRKLQILAFGISGLIIGTTGYLAAPVIAISPDSGFRYVLNGFIVAVVGGMGNNAGAMMAGPLLGILTMFTAFQIGGEFQLMVSLLVMVIVLIIRPEGIFGRAKARRV
jgi:branched-chain amino acid transport system permease protein